MGIDWEFIGALEGEGILKGYVPDAEGSKSGVTIATGVDLGQRSEASIGALDIPDSLKAKLKPYAGLKKQAAVDALRRNSLTITEGESRALDQAVKGGTVADVQERYDGAVAGGTVRFDDLSVQVQTVICSVAFQYGSNLSRAAPKFWRACTEQRWNAVLGELRNFGDRYPTRRNKEADLLEDAPELRD